MWDAWELPTAQAKLWNPTTNTFTDVTGRRRGVLRRPGHRRQRQPDRGGRPRRRRPRDQGRLLLRPRHPGVDQEARHGRTPLVPQPHADARQPDAHPQRREARSRPPGSDTPEIYNPTTSTLSTVPITHPRAARGCSTRRPTCCPNGKILAISAEHGGVMTFDPATNAWTRLGTTQVPYGAWTSFAPGKYLVTGGSATLDSYNPSNPVPSTRHAKVLDMTSGSPVWSDARHHGHRPVLPQRHDAADRRGAGDRRLDRGQRLLDHRHPDRRAVEPDDEHLAAGRAARTPADVPLDLHADAGRPGAVRRRWPTRPGARPAEHADVLARLPVQGTATDDHQPAGSDRRTARRWTW